MNVKRHIVSIHRPSGSLDSRGQRDDSQDTLIAARVPASIEPLNGRELEIARQNYPIASHRVRFFVSREWGLTPRDYIKFGERDLEIGFIDYEQEIQVEAVVTAGEYVRDTA